MDVSRGTPVPAWSPGPVNPEKMKIFAAIARDPNPIHWDRAAVAERGLGDRLINQGPINLGDVHFPREQRRQSSHSLGDPAEFELLDLGCVPPVLGHPAV